VADWYDKLSSGYEELYGEEQASKHRRALELIGNQRFNLVIDVGCGTGRLLEELSGRCNYLVGVDLSRRMLASARNELQSRKFDLIRADASFLPLTTQVADLVLAISLVELNGRANQQVMEMVRVATPAGCLVMTAFHPGGAMSMINSLGLKGATRCIELSARETLILIQGS
jgi:ubiquinone/menaquinone biosynthesis C-methylase UbiE